MESQSMFCLVFYTSTGQHTMAARLLFSGHYELLPGAGKWVLVTGERPVFVGRREFPPRGKFAIETKFTSDGRRIAHRLAEEEAGELKLVPGVQYAEFTPA